MNEERKRPLKVFLCHASGDKPVVRTIYQRLVRDGVDAWLDKEKLLPGQDWQLEIPRAVRESDVVIVCLSNNSITKEGYVQKEIKFALDIADEKPEGTIFLIPARLEECDVPSQLGLWHWVDLFESDGYERLMRSLQLRADKLGLGIADTRYIDPEVEQRLDQLYTEGLAALWVEDWDKAQHRFQAILREKPDHLQAIAKLDEARHQKYLNTLYVQALAAQEHENWPVAVETLEKLTSEVPDYRDAALLLKNSRRKKQLLELYEEALKLHKARQWQAVLKVFAQIAAIEPNYQDAAGLLSSAQKEVAEVERLEKLNKLYSQGVREMDQGHWYEARDFLERVHKAQTGFSETERLLRKVEDEIAKVEELNRRAIYINTLYEQAHGLVRSQNWREALDKIEEIQRLDNKFEDKEGIAEKAKTALELEEQEIQKQNRLAAMYAEAVRLLREGKYQEASDKWQEVKEIDPKYPDRQSVQRTARRKLVEATRVVGGRPTIYANRNLTLSIVGIFGFFSIIGLIVFIIFKTVPFFPFPFVPVKPISTSRSISTPVLPTLTPALEKDLTAVDYGKLIYEDNFDNANGWNDLAGSKLENGSLVMGPVVDAVPKPVIFTDFIFESQFSYRAGSSGIEFYLRHQIPPCSGWNCSIEVFINPAYDTVSAIRWLGDQSGQQLEIKSVIIDRQRIHFLPDQWNLISVIVHGEEYKVYINDVFIMNFYDGTYRSGSFILDNSGPTEIKIDYVRFYNLP